jgi:hypothetical protein
MEEAKGFNDFLNEAAYIDQQGELQGLNMGDVRVMEEADTLRTFLEDEGARRVTIEADEDIVKLRFEYAMRPLAIELDLEQDITTLFEERGDSEPLIMLQLASDEFFDLLAAKGLGKIVDGRL